MPGAERSAIAGVRLGLRENWPQFALLVVINAFVGGMVATQVAAGISAHARVGRPLYRVGRDGVPVTTVASQKNARRQRNAMAGFI